MAFKTKPTGGKRPGAGRKSKAVKMLEAGFVADWFTAEFQEIKWLELVNHEEANVALGAMKYLSDRLYGKPTEKRELTGPAGGPISAEVLVKFVKTGAHG